jgi:hypothetical protein
MIWDLLGKHGWMDDDDDDEWDFSVQELVLDIYITI